VGTLNLGILAHVDAGKTSLTERLLHAAGVIDEIGSVDDGTTRTDSLDLERRRGITIKSAVVSFALGDVTVNLIDTPGHPDFIAEVERVLGVLDGAVLVVSAVEGVQAQTRVLMRTLRRLGIPTLIFVNKIDRRGADGARVLRSMAERLSPAVVAMGEAVDQGTRDARFFPHSSQDAASTACLVELLAEHDDALLAAYVSDDAHVSHRRLYDELAAQTKRALVHPVFFGSAITGAGIDALGEGIRTLLPSVEGGAEDSSPGPVSGTVFKVERGAAGEKIAYVRVFSGVVRLRDRLPSYRDGREQEAKSLVTAIKVFEQGSDLRRPSVSAGQIGKLWGLADVRIGDTLGEPRDTAERAVHFAPPTLETVVAPVRAGDKGALYTALAQLAEQDPLINLRLDELRQELSVSLYGEVQKEVVETTLAEEFGLEVAFRSSTTICVERPVGAGAAFELMSKAPNPFLATVGLRVEPAPVGAGVAFRLEVELGSLPYAFFKAVEDTVRETLRQGLYGWQVTDCTVTMTHSGFDNATSTAGDFRSLTPLVLMNALRAAGTQVCEPMHRFRLEIPADVLGLLMPVLARRRAVPQSSTTCGPVCVLEGHVPAAQVHDLERALPSLSRGEGLLEYAFDHYRPVHGEPPTRPRSDHNPLNRKEYLLHIQRRA